MNYIALRTELLSDPLSRNYAGMNDTAAANDLNTAYRSRQKPTLSSAVIYENIDTAEFQAKNDTQKTYIRDILGLGSDVVITPGSKARNVLVTIFGAQSQTITNLAAAATETISRAEELSLGKITPGDVTLARGGAW